MAVHLAGKKEGGGGETAYIVDDDNDENGSGDGDLEMVALIRMRWTNEIIRK